MEIKINMLDVKDGDALIIELIKPDKTLVMVIDGGEPTYYKTKLKSKLAGVLKSHKKKAPDIVVCTHYDSDHIGGLVPLIEDYISEIKEVWVHKTPEVIKGYIEKALQLKENGGLKNIKSRDNVVIDSLFESYASPQKELLDDKAKLIIESLPQLKRLIDLITANKLRQVFYKQKPLPYWKEITVLGPTREYFNSLFPSTKSFEAFITEEAEEVLPSGKVELRLLEMAGIKPCDTLKKDADTNLTATNKASIIISIDNYNGRYLLTGDAGIESFKAIPNWQDELKNLHFLKVPHHASENNISKELIELMQPVYAYNTGYKYQDDAVLKCLAQKPRNIRSVQNK